MANIDEQNHAAIKTRLKEQATADIMRITAHAHQEMVEEDISMDEIREVLIDAAVVENYSEHKRGPCCLLCRKTSRERFIHVVCTTSLEYAIIITVYEPKPPKWITLFQRGAAQ